MTAESALRKTSQELMPVRPGRAPDGGYEIYPSHAIGPGRIEVGFDALSVRLAGHRVVVIDGFGGVLWNDFRVRLGAALAKRGILVAWIDVAEAQRPAAEVDRLTAPFLGGDDPLFGRAFEGSLADFYDPEKLARLRPAPHTADLTILYGSGAALAGWDGPLVYVDLPKNEFQFRARAGMVHNLGSNTLASDRETYKRCYFVDWPALARHKASLLPRIDLLVDEQRPDEPTAIAGDDLRATLTRLARSVFRVRPWFEPGPWGGDWIKAHITQLPKEPPNYAWSFELIAPENGLLLESDGAVLEVSFDTLMFHDPAAVLGESAARFGSEFPIRFDFLDTFGGGNLSVQVHPRPDYIRDHFGERFTQDETYYILDSRPGAEVYLGFQDDIDPDAFRSALQDSAAHDTPVDIRRFVQTHPSARHDLFLIPHGTIHCSGVDNLVLEISATPYIFTFKMYDWLRVDLDGNPRVLNLDRAFANVFFDRRGTRVQEEFISRPVEIRAGPGWRLTHLPTHRDHFYDVHRLELDGEIELPTSRSVQVMSVVEGKSVLVESGGETRRFAFAETFVVPAAADAFRLSTLDGPVKVVIAFVKPMPAQ